MNWTYDDALVTADRQAFFKFMVKSIAEKHGLRATFMPKPSAIPNSKGTDYTEKGSGCSRKYKRRINQELSNVWK